MPAGPNITIDAMPVAYRGLPHGAPYHCLHTHAHAHMPPQRPPAIYTLDIHTLCVVVGGCGVDLPHPTYPTPPTTFPTRWVEDIPYGMFEHERGAAMA